MLRSGEGVWVDLFSSPPPPIGKLKFIKFTHNGLDPPPKKKRNPPEKVSSSANEFDI